MPVYLIPLLYVLLFLFWLQRQGYNGGIRPLWWQTAWMVHVLAGFVNLAMWVFVVGHGDSIKYLHDAHMIWETLWTHPSHFLELTFGWGADNVYPEHLRYISDPLKYSWNNIEYTMVRINAILYVFTFGNAWGNIVLLNAGYFLGARYLYIRLWQRHPGKKFRLFLLVFFIPGLVAWSSGTLKEGPALLLLMLITGLLLDLERQFKPKHLLWLLICLIGLLLIRDYYVVFLLPLLFLWWMGQRFRNSGWLFGGSVLAGLLLVAIADRSSEKLSVTEILCETQQYYIFFGEDPEYKYHLFSGIDPLEPVTQIPAVLNNIFFRPNVMHSRDPVRVYFSLELLFLWILICWMMVHVLSRGLHISPTTWLLTAMALALLLLYGYVVTDADTMSRYRSIPLFLLLVAWILPAENGTSRQKQI